MSKPRDLWVVHNDMWSKAAIHKTKEEAEEDLLANGKESSYQIIHLREVVDDDALESAEHLLRRAVRQLYDESFLHENIKEWLAKHGRSKE